MSDFCRSIPRLTLAELKRRSQSFQCMLTCWSRSLAEERLQVMLRACGACRSRRPCIILTACKECWAYNGICQLRLFKICALRDKRGKTVVSLQLFFLVKQMRCMLYSKSLPSLYYWANNIKKCTLLNILYSNARTCFCQTEKKPFRAITDASVNGVLYAKISRWSFTFPSQLHFLVY